MPDVSTPLGAITTPSKKVSSPRGEVTVYLLPVLPPSPFISAHTDDAGNQLSFSYDINGLIASHREPIPLDVGHATDVSAGAPSLGWSHGYCSTETEADPPASMVPGGLYGWFELNDLGLEALKNRHFGFTSASTRVSGSVITGIRALTLTNNPASPNHILFSAATSLEVVDDYTRHQQLETGEDPVTYEEILAAFGLPAETDADTAKAYFAKAAAALKAAEEAVEVKDEAEPPATEKKEDAPATPADAVAFSAQLAAQQAQIDAMTKLLSEQRVAFSALTRINSAPASVDPLRAVLFSRHGLTAAEAAEADRLGESYELYAKNKRDTAYLVKR